ncbi:MAG: hypothetical protein FD145_1174 [Candidatus Saganbacteria bacterium]|uniref:Uncharacterized protein n=1 Tax=Candidatus Saganbacteria bacterium TaxID=2575572 RepID=A0A833L0H2_UNCSA|nr:MAG: hypothetical protein FD145_1174 [Candidatus Saganbacteria bacterium]
MEKPLILVVEDEFKMADNIAEVIKGTHRYGDCCEIKGMSRG